MLEGAAKARKGLNNGLSRMKAINNEIQNIAAVAQEQAESSKEMARSVDFTTQWTVDVDMKLEWIQSASAEVTQASEGVAMASQTLSDHAAHIRDTLSYFKTEEALNVIPEATEQENLH